MAFKLNKQESEQRDELESELRASQDGLEDAKSALEEAINALIATFRTEHVEPFNELLNKARGFAEDIVSEREGEFDEKSERWQEGERGEAARSWIDEWQNGVDDLDDISIDDIELDCDITDAAGTLEGLPLEADN